MVDLGSDLVEVVRTESAFEGVGRCGAVLNRTWEVRLREPHLVGVTVGCGGAVQNRTWEVHLRESHLGGATVAFGGAGYRTAFVKCG